MSTKHGNCWCCGEYGDLFAPFGEGEAVYCSDCQMEAEAQENNDVDYQLSFENER